MALNEPGYFAFLAVAFILYYLLAPGLPRQLVMLALGYWFYYSLSGIFLVVLLSVTAIAWLGGLAIAASGERRRGATLAVVLIAAAVPLLECKYAGFLAHNLALAGQAAGLGWSAPALALVLPIGISFFTFMAMGYLIDVDLGVTEPETRPHVVALYLAFFPIVTAGPIERAHRLLPQLALSNRFSADSAIHGLRLILIGLLLKVVIAGRLVGPVNALFAAPGSYDPLQKLFAMVYFAFYAYTDFAGYSLIAIGSARLFGIDVMANFRQPYLSTTIPEFWRNWHISLTSWVRDYLFQPIRLAWRRRGTAGMAGATLIAFLVIGIWHGAAWGFVVFGLMHGALAVASNLTLSARDAAWTRIGAPAPVVIGWRRLVTFAILTATLVPYRAPDLHVAMGIYRDVFSVRFLETVTHAVGLVLHGHGTNMKLIGLTSIGWILIGGVVVGDWCVRRGWPIWKFPRAVQVVFYNAALLAVVYQWITVNAGQPFLYYRF